MESLTNISLSLEKVTEYLKDNTGNREDGALFFVVKGKGGGIRRWSDVEEE